MILKDNYTIYLNLLWIFFFLSCSSTGTTVDISNSLNELSNPSSKHIMVAAHRGAHIDNFENSIVSIEKAIELGVDIVELDVRTTKDNIPVLLHDEAIDRTTTGTGKIGDFTLAELKKYKLKSPYGRISTESVPTFEEALKTAKDRIIIDIDLKTDHIEPIVKVVQKLEMTDQVLFFDDDFELLEKIMAIEPSAKFMPRAHSVEEVKIAIKKFTPSVVHIDKSFISKELTDKMKDNKARVWINALGEPDGYIRYGEGEKVLKLLVGYGANVIQTNEPKMVLELLRYKGLHK